MLSRQLLRVFEWGLRNLGLPVSVGIMILMLVLDVHPQKDSAWIWSAFGGLVGMFGFMLAAVALVQSVEARGQEAKRLHEGPPGQLPWVARVIESDGWNAAINAMVTAMWWWMVSSLCVSVLWFCYGKVAYAIWAASLAMAMSRGFLALFAVHALVKWSRNDIS